MWELVTVLSGHIRLGDVQLRAGDVLHTSAGEQHDFESFSESVFLVTAGQDRQLGQGGHAPPIPRPGITARHHTGMRVPAALNCTGAWGTPGTTSRSMPSMAMVERRSEDSCSAPGGPSVGGSAKPCGVRA